MSLGKTRHLAACATSEGHFLVLAIDHRANLRQALEHAGPISDLAFRDFKLQVVEASAPRVSAVLADPGYVLGSLVAGRLYGGGLLSPLEVTDYDVHPCQRELRMIPGWSVEKAKRLGCDGLKLLLPYHPQLPTAAARNRQVEELVTECRQYDIPLFLEPIACALSPDEKLSPSRQRELTVEMAQHFSALGADVLKLQLPGEPAEWEPTCRELGKVCSVPWALLSGGVGFDDYCRQAERACFHGASGVIVGRAVWNEATRLEGRERAQFLREAVPRRLERLADLCAAGTPWFERFPVAEPAVDWYESY